MAQKNSKRKTPILVLILIAVVGYVFYQVGQGNLQTTTAPKAPTLSEAEKSDIKKEAIERANQTLETETIYEAKKAVSVLLKDPSSAEFKEVFFNETQKGGPVACGQVNSKNSLGAYTGFQRFISNGKTTFIEESDENFADTWVQVCLPEN